MAVATALVTLVARSRDPKQVDALFRQALAEVLPAGIVQPRWIASRVGIAGVFEGYGAVRDFADWCDALGAKPDLLYGPPPEVELWADAKVRGHLIRVHCAADEREARNYIRLCPSWAAVH